MSASNKYYYKNNDIINIVSGSTIIAGTSGSNNYTSNGYPYFPGADTTNSENLSIVRPTLGYKINTNTDIGSNKTAIFYEYTDSTTNVLPNWCGKISIMSIGGGGGGGGSGNGVMNPNNPNVSGAGGGGGGAGNFVYTQINVSPAATLSIIVGKGGSKGTCTASQYQTGNTGGKGGDSYVTISGINYAYAYGGNGGLGGKPEGQGRGIHGNVNGNNTDSLSPNIATDGENYVNESNYIVQGGTGGSTLLYTNIPLAPTRTVYPTTTAYLSDYLPTALGNNTMNAQYSYGTGGNGGATSSQTNEPTGSWSGAYNNWRNGNDGETGLVRIYYLP